MEVRAESGVRRDDGGCEAVGVTVRKQVKDGGKNCETKAGKESWAGGRRWQRDRMRPGR